MFVTLPSMPLLGKCQEENNRCHLYYFFANTIMLGQLRCKCVSVSYESVRKQEYQSTDNPFYSCFQESGSPSSPYIHRECLFQLKQSDIWSIRVNRECFVESCCHQGEEIFKVETQENTDQGMLGDSSFSGSCPQNSENLLMCLKLKNSWDFWFKRKARVQASSLLLK